MRISDWSSDVCSSDLAASWKPEEGHPALLRAFAEAEGAGGRLRMGIARIEGVPVAAQYWTVEDGTAFIHKLAHVEDSLQASPGTKSEERRVGKECVSPCRSRWARYH